MAHVVNGPRSIRRLEGAVEHRQMFRLQSRSAFDGAPVIEMIHDSFYGWIVVAELSQCRRNRVVDDLDCSAADELLVLDESQVGFDTSRVAVHHESDRTRGSQNRGLSVAISM